MCTVRLGLAVSAALAVSFSASAESPGLGQSLADKDIPFYARYVMPDGIGLPDGRGSAVMGKPVWEKQCAACHGQTGSEGPIMPPVGPTPAYPKSAGKFWPYSTTLFEYIRRAMPFPTPKALSNDDVYAVTAFILYKNGLIKEDTVIDAKSLPTIAMPGRDNLIDLWAKQREKPY